MTPFGIILNSGNLYRTPRRLGVSLTGKAFLSRLCEVLSLTPSTIKTTNIPLRLMLDSAAPQDQVRVRFLEHSWPSSLVYLAWPFQGLVVSISELRDHHPAPAWHRNRTQLAFMERCTGAPFWPQRQVSRSAGFFFWGPGIFRGSVTLSQESSHRHLNPKSCPQVQ